MNMGAGRNEMLGRTTWIGSLSRIMFGLLAAVLFLFLYSNCVMGQTGTATLSGLVTDPAGAVVPNCEVQLQSVERGTIAAVKTNSDGIYVFNFIQPGQYNIAIRRSGFKQVDLVGVILNTQDHVQQNFRLQVGSISESVTVEGNGLNINTTDAGVSTVVDREFVQNTPLNGRSLQDLWTLVPGVVMVGNMGSGGNTGPGEGGEISVNGQRTEANYFTVDGVGANTGPSEFFAIGAGVAGATPAETALGTTQALVSIDALQEFRVSTSTYSAEYGRTPGGQFSFTTRAGANEWHGSAFDYFRNEALDANNWFNNAAQPQISREKERQNDFGGTLGGPILVPGLYNGRDKTFFFFSYEGLRLWTPIGAQIFSTPDKTLRQQAPAALQPFLNAFPLPNAGEDGLGDGLGLYRGGLSDPSSIDVISLRVDHNFNNRFRAFVRYADTQTVASQFKFAVRNDLSINNWLVTLGATEVIGSTASNEFRFNITESNTIANDVSTNLGGANPISLGSVPGLPSTGSGLFFFLNFAGGQPNLSLGRTQNSQRQYNLVDTYSWQRGNNGLRFGIDWRRLTTYMIPLVIEEGATFNSEASVLANSVDFGQAYSASPSPVEPLYKNFSAFAQDNWRTTPRLSLSVGLRWDVNPAPVNLTGPSPYTVDQITNLATTKLAAAGTPLWKTDWTGFAPRIGAAYQVRQASGRETVVRGGFGVFYDMGNSAGSTGFGSIGFHSTANFSGVSFPLTSAQLAVPAPNILPPYNNLIWAFDPKLKLPYTLQWNLAIEQALGNSSAVTLTYLGSAGRRLLAQFQYAPESFGNPNFNANVCAGCLFITRNQATSDYDALQVQFQRRLSRGLQALAAYTFSHSIDDASNNFLLYQLLRASSDFDIRHNFQAGLTYDLPGQVGNHFWSAILGHWGLDTRISVRSALPVNIVATQLFDPATSAFLSYNPKVVSGQPVYLFGSQYPGGKIINYNAFTPAIDANGNPIQGDAGRNSARDFGASQVNFALRREFPIRERLRLQFRAEAFNLFNHPNFSGVNVYLSSGPCGLGVTYCFGMATNTLNVLVGGLNQLYQIGGPRSLQIALKLQF